MNRSALAIILLFLGAVFLIAGSATAASTIIPSATTTLSVTPTPQQTPIPQVASAEQLQAAYAAWSASRHANTYDQGLGSNTTCAKCKSPTNWDPGNLSQDNALDCYACKRTPGEPRPDLAGSTPVDQANWHSIGCNVCHQPVGDSYSVAISFWDQASQTYLPTQNVDELCAHCHEAQHGFQVIEEQQASIAHQGWACTKCHGSHNKPVACTDCHDPQTAAGAAEHARHPSVNCTACHDAGGLGIWLDANPASRYFSTYMPQRYGHTLRSWPSHDISRVVDCKRCHHPANKEIPVVAQQVGCESCHPDGATLFWCDFFPRDGDPNPTPTPTPTPTTEP